MSNLDSWFQELLQPLRMRAQGAHPSRAVLHAYVKGQLPDTWRLRAHSLDLDDWTLTEVSQHTLVCRDCAQQLAFLRRRELEHAMLWRDLWHRFPSAIRAHVVAYTVALLALFALNAFLVTMLPRPTILLPCVSPVDAAEPAQPVNPQMSDKHLKLEGLNRPVKLPSSLSGTCAPVPAPRPPWQIWWVGWVFLLWTMLLGLHILWDWLEGTLPAQRHTATTSLVSFAPIFL
jgi:hypothetical protein